MVVLGDGARWIWNAAAEQCGERIEIVDWYHATQHLALVARTVFGEGTASAEAWYQASKAVLWNQGAAELLPRLRKLHAPTPDAQQKITVECGSVQTNQQRMRYGAFRAQGLPVGSGAVEGTAKYLVQTRMQRPGSRWSHEGAHAVMVLRARHLTEQAKAA